MLEIKMKRHINMSCRLTGSLEDSMNMHFLLMKNSMKLQRTDGHKELGIHHDLQHTSYFMMKKMNKFVCNSLY